MKDRVLQICCAVLAASIVPSLFAVLPPRQAPLENYDIRENAVSAASLTKPAEDNAAAALRSRVPKLQFSRDPVLNTPRHIGARAGFLSGPQGFGGAISQSSLDAISSDDPHRVVKAFLNENAAALGHDATILQSARVERNSIGSHNGLRTTVWQQTQNDIPVFGARFISNVTKDDELVRVSDQFIASPATAAANGTPGYENLFANPPVSAQAAINIASANSGGALSAPSLSLLDPPQGASQRQAFSSQDLFGKTHAQLTWLPLGPDSMRLAWQVIIGHREPLSRYLVLVDAQSGEMLLRRSLVSHATHRYNIYEGASPSPFNPSWQDPDTNQPPNIDRVIVTVTDAMDTNASPLGWVQGGRPPPNQNVTRGNNVFAFTDRDFDGVADGDFYPTGGPGPDLNYNFPFTLTNSPLIYSNAAAVQLFWRANWYHDLLYQLGFTEENGNYQVTNFNRGGLGNDPVYMLAQAGADVGVSDNAVFFSSPDGIEAYCAMFIWSLPVPLRDGAYDSEVVIHELTHGLTTRMVGAGQGISALQTGGMGEGWSDFYALAMLSAETNDHHAAYSTGGYVTYGLVPQNYYYGIRRYPYSTDLQKNPLTFRDIDPTQANAHRGIPINPVIGGGPADEVHNMGEVWCMMLWEVRANIIDTLGWQDGNQLVLQLVTDGLLLSPPNPNFVEARDAILMADRIYTGGAFYDQIWKAFAKRGLGELASSPAATTARGVVESYSVPADVAVGAPDGKLEVKINPPPGTLLLATETNVLAVRVSDTDLINDADVSATVNSAPLTFVNTGQTPDKYAGDGTYSANFVAPTNSSVTIPVVVSADEKEAVTNFVTYPIVPVPPNDNFSNSFKVAFNGASVFTSNKRATLEKGEPVHTATADFSLWYNFAPTSNGDVLVDSTGSEIRTVVAVYTNSSLNELGLVASAVGSSGRLGAFVNFKGAAGVVYRIAVASADGRTTGPIRLRVGQGLVADTLAPFTTVTTPQNGFTTTTNRVTIRGAAVDPDPTPSGIKNISISVSSGIGEMVTTTVYPQQNYGGPPSTNWTANVGLRAGVNRLQISSLDYAGNRSSLVTLYVTYRAIEPPNDLFATASTLTNVSGVAIVNTRNATKELGEPNHAGFAGGRSAWWSFTATTDGILDLSTTNSGFDTVMAVYTGSKVGELTPLMANDDAFPYAPGGFSHISQAVRAGETYRIAVDGYDAAGGVLFLTYSYSTGAIYKVNITTTSGGSVSPSGLEVPAGSSVTLNAIPDDRYAFSIWSGGIVSMQNPLTFTVNGDINLNAEFLPVELLADDFETGGLQKLNWMTEGDAPWFVEAGTTNPAGGTYAARSGDISANQTSSLKLVSAFRTGDASFEVFVSSEPVWDRLGFYIDGQLMQQWSGNVAWRSFAFGLSAGTHTLEWRYAKDNAGDVGLDAAYIDNIHLPIAPESGTSIPAVLQLLQQSDGDYYIELTGQINQAYTLQRSFNLTRWEDIATGVATAGVLRFQDPEANGSQEALYYRAYTP